VEIREYLRILRRRAWIPLLLLIVTVLATGVFAFMSPPEYTATATVLAKSQSNGTDKTLSFQEIAASNNLALRVRQQLKLSDSVDDLTNRTSVTSGRSNLYKVSYTDADPNRATTVANAMAKGAAQLYQELGGDTTTSITKDLEGDQANYRDRYLVTAKALVDYSRQHPDGINSKDSNVASQTMLLQLDERAASDAYMNFQQDVTKARVDQTTNARLFQASVVDDAAAKPNTTGRFLKVAYAAALALVVGVGIIFAVEYLDNSIREPEEVEQLIGTAVVGIIPRANARTLRSAHGGA
jgi:capsular polysaccharide biosynthesis protein